MFTPRTKPKASQHIQLEIARYEYIMANRHLIPIFDDDFGDDDFMIDEDDIAYVDGEYDENGVFKYCTEVEKLFNPMK